MANATKHLLAEFSDSGTQSETYLDGLPIKRHMHRSEILRVFQQCQTVSKLSRVALLRLEKASQDLRAYWNNSPELHCPFINCIQKAVLDIPTLLCEDNGACFAAQDFLSAVAYFTRDSKELQDIRASSNLANLERLISNVKEDHCAKLQKAIKDRKRDQRKRKEAQKKFCERLFKRTPAILQENLIIDANVIAAQIQASIYNAGRVAVFIEIDGVLASQRSLGRLEINPEAEGFLEDLSNNELWLFNIERCSIDSLLPVLDPSSEIISSQRVLIGITEAELLEQVLHTSKALKALVVTYRVVSGLENLLVPVLPFTRDNKIREHAAMLRTCSGLTPLQAAAKVIRDRSKGVH